MMQGIQHPVGDSAYTRVSTVTGTQIKKLNSSFCMDISSTIFPLSTITSFGEFVALLQCSADIVRSYLIFRVTP